MDFNLLLIIVAVIFAVAMTILSLVNWILAYRRLKFFRSRSAALDRQLKEIDTQIAIAKAKLERSLEESRKN
jgi:biopolymer transport protein ExbB/TolQ